MRNEPCEKTLIPLITNVKFFLDKEVKPLLDYFSG
jgi:hypothetical protein